MNRTVKIYASLLALGVIINISACKKEVPVPENEDDMQAQVVMADNSIWIDDQTAMNLVSVDSSVIVFQGSSNQLSSLSSGMIIVSGVTENAPHGILQRITSIQQVDQLYTLTTEDVSLTEAFEELHIEYSKEFSLDDTLRSGPVFEINLSNVIVYDGDGDHGTIADQVKFNGSMEVEPSLAVSINITHGQLIHARIEGTLNATLANTFTAGGSVGLFGGFRDLPDVQLASLTIPGTPIVVVPTVVVRYGAQGSVNASLSAGYSSELDVSAYLEYASGSWANGFSRHMSSTSLIGDIEGNIGARAYVRPGLAFRFFNLGSAQGYVQADAYLSTTAAFLPTPSCEIRAGVAVEIGANLRFFRTDFLNVSYNLFDYSTVLHTCNGQAIAPVAAFSGTPTSLTVGGSVQFTDLSYGNPSAWNWQFPGGTPSTSTATSPSITYNSPGVYSVTLTVENGNGNDSFTQTNYITVTAGGAAPVAEFIASETTIGVSQAISFTDLSSNDPVSWEWSFSGAMPSTSSLQNPSGIAYSTPGTYSVTLTASNAFGTDIETKDAYISVSQGGSGCGGVVTVTDIDGNEYPVVTIGNQCWMAENLRTTQLNDGTSIMNITDNFEWTVQTTGAWCNYANGYDAIFGSLYNWHAAANPNICPLGWHMPTDAEWQQLEGVLGMPGSELGLTDFRGSNQNVGGKMKTTTSSQWQPPNTGATNESGFSGLPGSCRSHLDGYFYALTSLGYWWSASESGAETAWGRCLAWDKAGINRYDFNKRYGFCLRCVRD